MVDSTPKKRVNVPEIIHTKWDEMLTPYFSIASKVKERSSNLIEQSFKTRYGIVVDLRDFVSRMESVIYKLRWATSGLEYLLEVSGKYTGLMMPPCVGLRTLFQRNSYSKRMFSFLLHILR